MGKTTKLKVPKKIWDQLEFKAAQNKQSAETLALGLLNMGASMDSAVWPSLTHVSSKANVPEALVLQNCVILYLAIRTAWKENFPEEDFPIPEFVRWRSGIKTGQAYFDQLVGFFKGENAWGKRFMEEFTTGEYEPLVKYPPK